MKLLLTRSARRSLGLGTSAVALVLAAASGAQAHVHTSPEQVKPGASTTVFFLIGHGCSGSPTTSVAIKVPATVTKVSGVAPKGWTASLSNSVVTFTGGTLADKVKGSFGVTFTAPAKTGTLLFPTVQTCVKGKNSWIDAPLANGAEPENPAPIVVVTNTPAATKKKTVAAH
jgi:uncharacterized protein YcnI